MNRFEYDAQGVLRHYINDELRAVVQPAYVADYRATWTICPPPAA